MKMSQPDKYSILPCESEVDIIRKVNLTMNEQKKYEVIKKLVETNGNKNRAAVELGCTRRTIDRLIRSYRQNGKAAFSHGNKGRSPAHTIHPDVKQQIYLLYENKYFDSNFRHFTQLLEEYENIHISEGTVRTVLLEKDILSPKAHRSTKKAYKEKLRARKQDAKNKKEKTDIEEKIRLVDDPHPRRPRCQYAGEMIQMDASVHLWFGDSKTTLHAAIDDATGTIVGAYFDAQETLDGYYHVFEQILKNYGIPYLFYTDRRTIFEYKQKNSPSLENDTFTQFGYACKQLGVDIKTTSIPQAKGRIERLFGTLQSRLPIELRMAGIKTTEQANEFLRSYLKKFNAQFALDMHCIRSVFEEQPDNEKIDQILAVIAPRKIDAGHCIKFKNKYYKLLDAQGMRTDFYKGTDALVIRTLSGKLYANVADNIYFLEEVPTHETASRYFDTKQKQEQIGQKKPRYIPDMDHPWRKDNFTKYVYTMVGREENWAC